MMSRFIGGKGLFMFNGDWESGNLDKQMAGNAGFFLMPPAQAGGKQAAMSAPLTYGIGAKAKNADCAAFFLNWVATNTEGPRDRRRGRRLAPDGSRRRLHARGRAGHRHRERPSPPARTIGKDNGAMDFIANATGAIYAKGWTPQLQKLVAGQQTPDGLLKAVQKDYESQVAK